MLHLRNSIGCISPVRSNLTTNYKGHKVVDNHDPLHPEETLHIESIEIFTSKTCYATSIASCHLDFLCIPNGFSEERLLFETE